MHQTITQVTHSTMAPGGSILAARRCILFWKKSKISNPAQPLLNSSSMRFYAYFRHSSREHNNRLTNNQI